MRRLTVVVLMVLPLCACDASPKVDMTAEMALAKSADVEGRVLLLEQKVRALEAENDVQRSIMTRQAERMKTLDQNEAVRMRQEAIDDFIATTPPRYGQER